MRAAIALVACASLLSASRPARAEPSSQPLATAPSERPSKGTGFLIAGTILTGIGAVTVIGTPSICKTGTGSATTGKSTAGCERFGYIFGASLAAVGIPLMIVGLVKRSNYNAWMAEHPVASRLSVSPLAGGGGALGWSSTF
ncbi:MAG TPA: hypothetical protein PLR99_20770 [Polyangiaceae bacterium]|nr:hypothetical protein [Polyangiaceae bacterium]